jgi:hypothetical protein
MVIHPGPLVDGNSGISGVFNDVALDLTRRFALSAALASRQD